MYQFLLTLIVSISLQRLVVKTLTCTKGRGLQGAIAECKAKILHKLSWPKSQWQKLAFVGGAIYIYLLYLPVYPLRHIKMTLAHKLCTVVYGVYCFIYIQNVYIPPSNCLTVHLAL